MIAMNNSCCSLSQVLNWLGNTALIEMNDRSFRNELDDVVGGNGDWAIAIANEFLVNQSWFVNWRTKEVLQLSLIRLAVQ